MVSAPAGVAPREVNPSTSTSIVYARPAPPSVEDSAVPAVKTRSALNEPVAVNTKYCADASLFPPLVVLVIVTEPSEPVTIVTPEPSLRKEVPSASFVNDPLNERALTREPVKNETVPTDPLMFERNA
jgi:hypothetical protein